jgi:nitrogen regulatory protein PII
MKEVIAIIRRHRLQETKGRSSWDRIPALTMVSVEREEENRRDSGLEL